MIIRWITRHLVGVAITVGLAGVVTGAVAARSALQAHIGAGVAAERAQDRIATLEAVVAANLAAQEVYRAHRTRMNAEIAASNELIRELTNLEGLDNALSDPAASAAGRLWRQ